MKERNLDGIYFRVKRTDKWENICFSDLTLEEMNKILENRNEEWLKALCIELGQVIRKIGDDLDIAILSEEEIAELKAEQEKEGE